MNWVQTDCSCPSNLKCLRPVLYSKPTFCVPEKILPENFEKYVSNPLQFFHQNCTNMDTTVLFIILVSIFFQVNFVFSVNKSRLGLYLATSGFTSHSFECYSGTTPLK